MKRFNWLAAVLTTVALVACGGGGGSAGTSPLFPDVPTDPDNPTVVASSVEVLTSETQIQSGSGTATISAVVKGAGNAALASFPVSFSADSGNLTSVSVTTDEKGVATAVLSPGADKSNRTIAVSVSAGTVSGAVQVEIAGTKLVISGPSTLTLGNARTYTLTLSDPRDVGLANMPIQVASSNNNGLSASSVTTNASGIATVTYTATNAGADTLSFNGAGATASQVVTVSGEDFTFVDPDASTSVPTVVVGTPQNVKVRYIQGGAPKAGVTVNFSSTAGTVSPTSAVTDSAGEATVQVQSATANPATVLARAVGIDAEATLPLLFVATTPSKLVLQVNPASLPPNAAGSSTQQVSVIATVTDASGNPVANKFVNFSRLSDPSGGNLDQPSSKTDANGKASVNYISGPGTTASNGVVLKGEVDGTSVNGQTSLTVSQSSLFIALGTSNVISNASPEVYQKDWVVYVTDANGVAVPNMKLTMKVLPVSYEKGQLSWNSKQWVKAGTIHVCQNEDVNFNGNMDSGEDTNTSGVIEPGNVISLKEGVVTTDSTGRAVVTLLYAESYAPWVNVRLRAEAIVSGTESSKEQQFTVMGASEDFTVETVAPAGQTSPFGVNACNQAN